jgi:site-specific recombinase XerD
MVLVGAAAVVQQDLVVRYRIPLETRQLAPGTINLRLGSVRRLAYEAADCGLLSPDLAAGVRRVIRGKRDRALLAILLACGLRRHEIAELTVDHLQKREEHWGDGVTEKLVWHGLRNSRRGSATICSRHTTSIGTCARLCRAAGGALEQIQFLLGHVSVQTTERYLGCTQRIAAAVNDKIGIEPAS